MDTDILKIRHFTDILLIKFCVFSLLQDIKYKVLK